MRVLGAFTMKLKEELMEELTEELTEELEELLKLLTAVVLENSQGKQHWKTLMETPVGNSSGGNQHWKNAPPHNKRQAMKKRRSCWRGRAAE